MNQPIFQYPKPEQKEPPRSGRRVRRTPRLMERDYALLLDLLRLRFATTGQLCDLHFPGQGGQVGRLKACQRRLKQLADAGLIKALAIPLPKGEGTHPFVYVLTQRGLTRLSAEIGIDPADVSLPNLALTQYNLPEKGFENYEHLKHIIDCNAVSIALTRACQAVGIDIAEYLHEYELRTLQFIGQVKIKHPGTGQLRAYTFVPDAYFRLARGNQELRAFLEVDRSTIPVTRKSAHWALSAMTKKFRGYEAFFSSVDYQTRIGGQSLVLTVTKTPERLDSLYDAVRSTLGDDERFWFTTLPQATDPRQVLTAAIWQIADERFRNTDTGAFQRFSLLG
jgi:Replication-relaxation